MAIITRYTATFLDTYQDRESRRVILLRRGTPVYTIGDSYTVGLFRDYDEVALVTMTPFQRSRSIDSSIMSSDGVVFDGKLELTLQVCNDWNSLSAVCIDIDEEISISFGRVQVTLQAVIAKRTYSEVLSDVSGVAESLTTTVLQQHKVAPIAIRINGIRICSLTPRSDKLTKVRINRAEKLEELQIDRQNREIEAERRKAEAEAEYEAEKRRLELEKLKQEQEIQIAKQRELAQLELAKQRVELTKTEEGLLALDLATVMQFKTEQLKIREYIAKLDDRRQRDLLRALAGFQAGQNNVLATLAANQFGISLRDSSVETAEAIKGLLETSDDGNQQPNDRSAEQGSAGNPAEPGA